MKFTIFRDRFASAAYPQDASLEELARAIPQTIRQRKEDLPLVKLAMFGEVPNDKDCLRYDANVAEVTGLEADYDGGKVGFKKAVEIAEKAALLTLIYTSPSYTAKKPRWRVLAPLSVGLPPGERDHQMGRLAGLYGNVFAAESWTLSQSYYFGRLAGAAPPLVTITSGQAIDLLTGLDAGAIARPNGIGGNGAVAGSGAFDEAALTRAIITGANYHRASLSLLGHWASFDVSMIEARDRLIAAFETVFPPDRDQRWRDRFGEIPKLIGFVYGKAADKADERITFTLHSSCAAIGEPVMTETPERTEQPNEDVPDDDAAKLPVANWVTREVALSDRVLGHLITTTSRVLLVAPTGLGKTNLALAMAFAISEGRGFLHWHGSGTPRRVLYIDGEMPVRLMRERIEDCVRRAGGVPKTMFVLSREDFPDMPPLNTPAGQQFVDGIIETIGGVDVVVFDNVQALLAGDMREEVPWRQTLPWVWSLTRRKIGQVWIHHTGHDESHSYGTKTREWQLDTVGLMEAVERPETDVAFALKFTKARERVAHNRDDFDPVIITLANDCWAFERGSYTRRKYTAEDRALELLRDAVVREGVVPPASEHIPCETLCVTEGVWRRYCKAGCLSDGDPDPVRKDAAEKKAFRRAADKLIGRRVGKWELWVWLFK